MARGRRGAITLVDVHKSFRLYGSHSVKEALIHLGRGEPLFQRRAILNGVTATIAPGERVGIVGKNGAGKSTLFRLICGILTPDRGEVRVHGRVAPLIEITAGFVPDMTGNENLELNAVILGLSRREIAQRYDEIVDFAGVRELMETPMRYFSSGMVTRLGFAIVSHIDADILLVDEALAVGDVEYQRRCLERMDALARRGTSVVFVSHDLPAIEKFCPRSIWLEGGRVRMDGPSGEVLAEMVRVERDGADTGRVPR